MELHEDDPEHFEFVLKFIYTLNYDVNAIETAVGKDEKHEIVQYILGVYRVADKYDIGRLLGPAAAHLHKVLNTITEDSTLEFVVQHHYGSCSAPGHAAGNTIASTIIDTCRKFVRTQAFRTLLAKFPVFASDIALCYHEQGMFSIRRFKCKCGRKELVADPKVNEDASVRWYCVTCNQWQGIEVDDWK